MANIPYDKILSNSRQTPSQRKEGRCTSRLLQYRQACDFLHRPTCHVYQPTAVIGQEVAVCQVTSALSGGACCSHLLLLISVIYPSTI